jgi:N-acetylglucosamine-6-sulfatase
MGTGDASRTESRRHGKARWTRREWLTSMGRAALAAVGVSAALPKRGRAAFRSRPASSPDRPPNILVVLSDNHRWDAMSSAGHAFVRTPNLDRIGRAGLHFENAFCTTPLCSPARASFLTGLYAWQHGVQNHTTRARWDDAHATFLEELKRHAAYDTAFIGKWHMPGSGLPKLRGVDHFVTFTIQEGQGRYFECPLVVDGNEETSRKRYLTEELTDRALSFAAERRDRPFCVYLSHKAVHHPWRPAPDLEGIYADLPVELPEGANSWTGFTNGEIWGGFERPIERAIRSYMETVTSLDREIGRLLDGLDALGVADDTVVVYTSDNGFLFGEHKRVELRWPFEEVIRIPLLLRYPRLVRDPGRRAGQMALNIDLAPTLLELAGAPVPDALQGMSLLPVLRESSAPGRRAWLVENYKEFPYNAPSYQGVRTERHLYVEYEGRFAPTLHDVVRDPQQTRNLVGTGEGDALVPELRRILAALRRGERFDV